MTNRTFNWRVIEQIEKLIDESGLTRAEVITRSGLRRNTFFVKMRGETALTTDDIAKLAAALGVEPEVIFTRAAAEGTAPVTQLRPRGDVGASRQDLPAAARQADPDRGEDQ
ncbi:transcriptional regulator with XRE-family HTH domain [Microbacterium sp. SORGH_AS 505]|uniref:helix-turn-helix domain-containing protein n=1 Tax=Microbacterium sp. SORGH_AS_0505 TaxID=3041770 RepID=UPI0027872AAE|nr:helix-turn-helix transcriptional regulator [Microbacterium sp. SORGH_AS_0505]MDQ1127608.1 transcriptional regulator with XRE-family HTH domain [Microbacterium sp. SORGH_AS_0505]